MIRILLISNMYPSVENPSYGVFVKNFETQINSGREMAISQKVMISSQGGGMFQKVGRYLGFYYQVIKALLGYEFDQVYVHFPTYIAPVLLIWPKCKRKLVLNFHGSDVIGSGPKFTFFEYLTRMVIDKSDLVVVPSTFLASEIEKRLSVPKEKLYISPSGGVSSECFYPVNRVTARKQIGIDEQFTIGFISRFDSGKGWDVFVKAVSILQHQYGLRFQAVVVGDGEQRQEFLALVQELNVEDTLKYYGRKKQDELAVYFSSLELCVASSTLMESLGLIGLEAMSCGVPVVGSDRAGIATYVVDGFNGFLFEPGSADELAKAIMKYSSMDASERELISSQAFSTSNKFESVLVNQKLSKKLKELQAVN